MSKVFLDSNLLIYLYTTDEIKKGQQVQDLLRQWDNIIISTQVLFEFTYALLRKRKYNHSGLYKALKEFSKAFNVVIIASETILYALKIVSKYKYSFSDSLIIATALESDCQILFSEDMHAGQIIEKKLQIINPFSNQLISS